MKRLKKWLYSRFLPMWAKETLLKENRDLKQKIESLNHEIEKQKAYINGLEAGMRFSKKIIINNRGEN